MSRTNPAFAGSAAADPAFISQFDTSGRLRTGACEPASSAGTLGRSFDLRAGRCGRRVMTVEALTSLLGVLVWPAVVLIVVALMRRELAGLFGRVREIEGPGSLKVSLDPNKVEEIIKEGRKENAAPAEVAERIVRAAVVLDKREARILRALFDDDGRPIYSYQNDYYRAALESLLAKGYVQKRDKGFALTAEGQRVTREYLLGVLHGTEKTVPPPPGPAGK